MDVHAYKTCLPQIMIRDHLLPTILAKSEENYRILSLKLDTGDHFPTEISCGHNLGSNQTNSLDFYSETQLHPMQEQGYIAAGQ
jgi:hypothetical protein